MIEFVRAKDDRFLGAFTLAQLTSVVLVLVGALLLKQWSERPAVSPGDYLSASNILKTSRN